MEREIDTKECQRACGTVKEKPQILPLFCVPMYHKDQAHLGPAFPLKPRMVLTFLSIWRSSLHQEPVLGYAESNSLNSCFLSFFLYWEKLIKHVGSLRIFWGDLIVHWWPASRSTYWWTQTPSPTASLSRLCSGWARLGLRENDRRNFFFLSRKECPVVND